MLSEKSSPSFLLEDGTSHIYRVGPGYVLHMGNIIILSCHSGNIVSDMSWFILAFGGNIFIQSCINGNSIVLQFVLFSLFAS
jgi:hypothetical protein